MLNTKRPKTSGRVERCVDVDVDFDDRIDLTDVEEVELTYFGG